ncbi:PAS domain S-box protein [Aerosakkonema funiforme]|nr:PAS domain S-box protein [Aerosakkonema funiforme]
MASKAKIKKYSNYLAPDSVDIYVPARCVAEDREMRQMRMELEKLKRELKASEDRFHNAIAKSADGIVIVNQRGIVCFVNPCAESLFNSNEDELLGKEFFGCLVVEGTACEMDTEIIPKFGETTTSGICVVQTQVELIGKNQEKLLAEMRVVETEWEGEVAYLVSLRDITDRRRTEEMLRLYSRAMEAASTGIVIVDATKPDNAIVHCNPAFERITGYGREEVLGRNCRFLQGADTQEAVVDKLRNALRTQTSCRVVVKNYRKDGKPFWNDLSISPVRDRNGKLTHYIGVQNDITERIEVEEALANSEKLYRTLASNFPNGAVFLFDRDLRYTLAEGTDLEAVGLSKELLEGKTIRSVLPTEICDIIEPMYRSALAGITNVCEMSYGGYIYDTHILPLKNEQDEIFAGMVMTQNITKRKQTELALRQSETRFREQATELEQTLKDLQRTHAQLVQSEKMSSLGLLVAGVAHEINNPVNFISGNLNYVNQYTQELISLVKLFQEQYPNPGVQIQEKIEAIELDFVLEDLPKLVSSMKIGVDRICQIVLSLRNFSRLDEAEMKPVNLHEGIDSTLLILQNRLKLKGGHPSIEVIKEYGNLPEVECYAGPINQVFMNIISNAIDALEQDSRGAEDKFLIPNPQIRIRTEVLEDDRVIIRLADNGSGIKPEVRQRIFDPFFTTKPVGKGTGLGLSISYQIIVEKHGGELECNSELGHGTEFVIKIPIRHQKPQ